MSKLTNLTTIWLIVVVFSSSLLVPVAPAGAWLLPLLFRSVAFNVAKQDLKARYAIFCKKAPQRCRVKFSTRKKIARSKKLKKVYSKPKTQRIRQRSAHLR
jgi:hypothetical protein